MIRMIFIIVVLSFLTINLLLSDDQECNNPTSFIFFDALSGEGMGPRFFLVPQKLNFSDTSFKEFSLMITHQIIVDSMCIKSITNFILDYKNIKYSESNSQTDANSYFFYEFKKCKYDLIFGTFSSSDALIFFRNLKKYLGKKN